MSQELLNVNTTLKCFLLWHKLKQEYFSFDESSGYTKKFCARCWRKYPY